MHIFSFIKLLHFLFLLCIGSKPLFGIVAFNITMMVVVHSISLLRFWHANEHLHVQSLPMSYSTMHNVTSTFSRDACSPLQVARVNVILQCTFCCTSLSSPVLFFRFSFLLAFLYSVILLWSFCLSFR